MEEYDVAVIGGGLLGCFALRALARHRVRALLLEAREDVCSEISRANTAIVYAGYDMKPGSLKAAMTVRAARSFETLCRELDVRYSQCGAVMVCFGENGYQRLQKKLRQGAENGVAGLKLLSGREVLELEPNLSPNVRAGLYAPQCGTAIPWELGLAAAGNAIANGGKIRLNAAVTDIRDSGGGYVVTYGNQRLSAKSVINCAGMNAAKISEMAFAPKVRIVRTAGNYYVLDTKAGAFVKHVVFHEPEKKGKGLTLVPSVGGNILIGPTERKYDCSDDYSVTSEDLRQLRELVFEVIPSLPMEHIIRSFGAVRPNPYYVENGGLSEKSINDFCVLENAPNFVSLIGVKTPGMTCSAELGRHVADKIAAYLGAARNGNFNPAQRRSAHRAQELTFDERRQLVAANPAYGSIACRCREVSEGEIIEAIRGPLGAATVDGVKRRTGAGMGRCQGGFCQQRVIEILARERGLSKASVTKNGGKSYILRS
ncbi:MAG: FAD-dependent oxidoreductase [Synergistaceae bacterium]|jgi:glycerol-3-phosphate dehydrogenase|nr:FAD-dependent oxidoreductase [Synergistaceae bacterium]